ncbi:hypothetical protein [Streptomyces candidus]|uniref:RNA polymerase sigma-70 region 4 domain-containing protein n=2 Tax=Streptomyces candidus TaxID=67283 RepID=A0A7X0HPR8_9ACTN|nr:hypothetical protein [Streptomyces candidus]MBB6440108.1 hypothetical protein [Streptomyces candidus]
MTATPNPVDALIADLDSISDPVDRFHQAARIEAQIGKGLRAIRRKAATELRDSGKSYREVGESLGGISAQRVEQIVKGR